MSIDIRTRADGSVIVDWVAANGEQLEARAYPTSQVGEMHLYVGTPSARCGTTMVLPRDAARALASSLAALVVADEDRETRVRIEREAADDRSGSRALAALQEDPDLQNDLLAVLPDPEAELRTATEGRAA
ncbi:MAG: hypothetical protein M0P31_13840 [Solirubrobacteraceae bacterium]|nr:hypothetical protein [Solirubrobacteraceae bacterium]